MTLKWIREAARRAKVSLTGKISFPEATIFQQMLRGCFSREHDVPYRAKREEEDTTS